MLTTYGSLDALCPPFGCSSSYSPFGCRSTTTTVPVSAVHKTTCALIDFIFLSLFNRTNRVFLFFFFSSWRFRYLNPFTSVFLSSTGSEDEDDEGLDPAVKVVKEKERRQANSALILTVDCSGGDRAKRQPLPLRHWVVRSKLRRRGLGGREGLADHHLCQPQNFTRPKGQFHVPSFCLLLLYRHCVVLFFFFFG